MHHRNINLVRYLEEFLTPARCERLRSVLRERTRRIVCVLEDLYDPRNGSAIMRHCDALGIQEVHAIENSNTFHFSENVAMGSGQWLDLTIHHRSAKPDTKSMTPAVLEGFKSRGYRVVATVPGFQSRTPETLDLSTAPIALVFGTEKHGVSPQVRDAADTTLSIPMVGFVNSFNISAAAAIVLYTLSSRMRREGIPWQLSEEDADDVYFRWVKIALSCSDHLIRHFLKNGTSDKI